MLRWLRYRRDLYRLAQARAKLFSPPDDMEIMEHWEEVAKVQTRYLYSRATSLFVDIDFLTEGDWESSDFGGRYLKRGALARLNKAIRVEQLERRQAWIAYAPLLTGLTGFLGAAIGIVALLSHNNTPSPPAH